MAEVELTECSLAFPSGVPTFNTEGVDPDSYKLFGSLRMSPSPPLETISFNVAMKCSVPSHLVCGMTLKGEP